MRKSIPFSVTILTLMTLVVVPLAAVLLWLGWRASDTLEQDNINLRMAALGGAVTSWVSGQLRGIAWVGQTLAEGPSFSAASSSAVDEQLVRQLIAVLGRHGSIVAAYAGYADGRFVYAGRTSILSPEMRAELGASSSDDLLVRTIVGADSNRRESWHFVAPDGTRTPERSRPSDFDPRTRPWYREAMSVRTARMTEPYRFAQSGTQGISVATPIRDGAGGIGFDFALSNLSGVVAQYKPSSGSIVMVMTGAGNLIADSTDCSEDGARCEPVDGDVRDLLGRELTDAAQRADRQINLRVSFGGRAWKVLINPMPPVIGERILVGAAVPALEISAQSRTLLERAAVVGMLAVAIAILATFAIAYLLSRAIGRVAAKTERIRDLDFSDREPVRSRITEIVRLSDAVERMRGGLEVFGRYVPRTLVRQIMRSPQTAGAAGARRNVTVLFTDIEGFSRISESMPPELLTSRLSRYFEAMNGPILAHQGTIDKFIGDSIMAFWNAPEPDDHHVLNACRAALEAAASGKRLTDKWQERGRQHFRTRFGLHTGEAVVGNVGTPDRMNYTLVGTVVNQASRLEGLNKFYRTEVLASGEVAALTADALVWRHVDRVVPAGTTEPMNIFELLGERGDEGLAEFLERWNAARRIYKEGRFAEAIDGFAAAAALKPGDGPCAVLIDRCRRLERGGSSSPWDGTWRHDAK